MKKVFIDCGANSGRVTDSFFDKISKASEYEIICIEANPKFRENFEKKKYNCKFINAAVGDENKRIKFKIDESDVAYGSSSILSKRTGKFGKDFLDIKQIDIADFINSNYSIEDFIVLKIDIEGSEYDVLPHLKKTKAIEKIDIIFLDLHPNCKLGIDNNIFQKKLKLTNEFIKDYQHKIYLEPDFWNSEDDKNIFKKLKQIF